MRITRKQQSGNVVRSILIGMITDQTVISRIATCWTGRGMFESEHANLIGGWAVEHLRQYKKPLGREIEVVASSWAAGRDRNDGLVQSVEEFLQQLSQQFNNGSPLAADYLLDQAGLHFNRVHLRRQLDLASEALTDGLLDDVRNTARKLLSPIELGVGSTIDVLNDYSAIRKAIDRREEKYVVEFANEAHSLGVMLNHAMVRDGFLGVMGSDKMGKSFFLIDLAVRALKARRRVAYFECGDLGEAEVIGRMAQRITRKPLYQATVRWPMGWMKVGNEYEVQFESRVLEPLTPQEAFRAFQKYAKGKNLLHLSCHPNSSINVDGIEAILDQWSREDWVPDLVVIDYADILAPPAGIRDPLEQTDTTWKQLRRLSQRWHCLLVVATQASAQAYREDKPLRRRHFSGRKTKLAHVTGMIGLSRLQADFDLGITRVGWVIGRSWKWTEGESIPVAGVWEIGFPFYRSLNKNRLLSSSEDTTY